MEISNTQRLVGAAVLLVASLLSLPVTAWLFDGNPSLENLVIPMHLTAMTALGAVLAWRLQPLAPGLPATRRLLGGAGAGLLAAVVGLMVFWFALSGFGGA